MSLSSSISRALSIKTRTASVISYANKGGKGAEPGKSEAMQRVAVTLRQKQEYTRAERLMLRAIHVKKAILKTEVNEDIAYLYNELAITYQGHDALENATKCVKKQLLIFEELKKTNSLEYVQCLTFIGELYRDQEKSFEAIEVLQKAVVIHEDLTKGENAVAFALVPADLERSEFMKILAEELIKV